MTDDEDNGEKGDERIEEIIEEHDFEAEGWDEIPDDPEEVSKLLLALQGVVPDVVKRAVSASVEGLSASEERIRDAIPEKKLPKEAVAYLMQHADSFKREFFRILSREIREVLEEMDFGGELAKVLTRLSLEAHLEVRFRENPDSSSRDAVRPKASGKVRVKQSKEADEDEESDDD